MRRSVQVLMLTSCVLMSFSSTAAFAKDKHTGIDVDASVTLGAKKGLDVDVSGSIGGRKGIKADVDANLGGRKGLNANVDVSLGGNKGLNTDVDASIGGKKGINVDVDIGLGTDDGKPSTRPDVTVRDPKDNPVGGLTSSQRQAFNDMSTSERNALIKRCGTISSGGYDPALVNLCKLLRMSASR